MLKFLSENLAPVTDATFDRGLRTLGAEDGATVAVAAQDAIEASEVCLSDVDDRTWWPTLEFNVHDLTSVFISKAGTPLKASASYVFSL